MREIQLAVSSCVLPKFVCRAVRLQADENSHLVDIFESGINFVKATDIKIPDEAVEKPCVARQKRVESVPQVIPRLVGDEGQISGHLSEVGFCWRNLSQN